MYKSEHTDFILSPLSDILKEGFLACQAVGDGIESYPLCDYVLQSLFLKLTGAQEQKLKCICWDLATKDYDYRYEYLNRKNYGECSEYKAKNGIYLDLIDEIKKKEKNFEPKSIIEESLLIRSLNKSAAMYKSSVMSSWQRTEFNFYSNNVKSLFKQSQIGNDKKLFESQLQQHYTDIVYKHRNRCAHNALSYQRNKPDLDYLANKDFLYHSYFFMYTTLILIDDIFIALYEKYLSLYRDNYYVL